MVIAWKSNSVVGAQTSEKASKHAVYIFFVVRSMDSNIGGERDVGGVNLYIVILYCAILQQIF